MNQGTNLYIPQNVFGQAKTNLYIWIFDWLYIVLRQENLSHVWCSCLWAEREIYLATSTVVRGLDFCGQIWKNTTPHLVSLYDELVILSAYSNPNAQ